MNELFDNFIFVRILFIIIITLIGMVVIDDLKEKDKIRIEKYLNPKKINISLLLEYLFLTFIIRIVLEQLILFLPFKETIVQVPSDTFEIIVEFITTCIFAPIFEEIIFRFGLYKKLNKKYNVVISMIITSLVFAIVHIYSIDGIIILLVLALMWNYSFYKTNNLMYPIMLHFFHNTYALSSNLFNYGSYWYILLIINIIGYLIIVLKRQKS